MAQPVDDVGRVVTPGNFLRALSFGDDRPCETVIVLAGRVMNEDAFAVLAGKDHLRLAPRAPWLTGIAHQDAVRRARVVQRDPPADLRHKGHRNIAYGLVVDDRLSIRLQRTPLGASTVAPGVIHGANAAFEARGGNRSKICLALPVITRP